MKGQIQYVIGSIVVLYLLSIILPAVTCTEWKDKLANCTSYLDACNENLDTTGSELASCRNITAELQKNVTDLNGKLKDCTDENGRLSSINNGLKKDIENCNAQLKANTVLFLFHPNSLSMGGMLISTFLLAIITFFDGFKDISDENTSAAKFWLSVIAIVLTIINVIGII